MAVHVRRSSPPRARAAWIAGVSLLAGCAGCPPTEPPPAPADAPAHAPKRAPEAPTPREKLRPPEVASPAAADAPDVVVITLDTTRADHLGAYGYGRATSPRLDRLAAESVVFTRMIVPQATTLPTHTSLFTGVYPLEHGITANLEHGGKVFVPTERLTSLAQVLSEHGYQTGGFTSCAPLDETTGIQRGFQVFTSPHLEQRPGRVTAEDAVGWIEQAAPTPMLLWVHFYDPHNPYNPDPAYKDAFTDGSVDAWMAERKVSKQTQRPTGEVVRAKPTINAYDAEIRTMDDQVGRVLDALEARGRLDRTILVVLGDHGEGLNQHGEPGHGLVWDEQLHAPWMIRAPGLAPRKVEATVSAVDVLPTVLGLADLPGEALLSAQASGRDALAAGATDRAVLSQTSARQVGHGRAMLFAQTDGRWKCTWEEGTEQVTLYDLRADPFELAPVRDAAREAACLRDLRAQVDAQRARGEQLGAGKTTETSEARRIELICLGYLDGALPEGVDCKALQGSP